MKRENRRGKASLFRSPSIYEDKIDEEDEGMGQTLGKYIYFNTNKSFTIFTEKLIFDSHILFYLYF